MTEYDYSPDAYERYMEKQHNIARWAKEQANEAAYYRNPFVPTEYSSDSSRSSTPHQTTRPTIHRTNSPSVTRSRSVPVKSSDSSHHHHSQSSARRSTSSSTSPPHSNGHYYTRGGGSSYVSPNRVVVHHSGSPGRSSRSSSRPPRNSVDYYPGHRPAPARSQSYGPYYTTANGGHVTQQPYGSTGAPGQPVVVKKGNQTFVIVPSPDERLSVRSSTDPQGYFPNSSRSPVSDSRNKQPFLKRLFGLGPPVHSSTSRSPDSYAPPVSWR